MLTRDRRPVTPTGQAYTGAWRNATQFVDIALPPAPGVDPSHLQPDAPDPNAVPAGYPRVDYAPLYLTQMPDDAWIHEVDTPGVILSVEPESHDPGDAQVIHSSPFPGAEFDPPNMTAHMIDRGAQLLQLYADPSMRASDERPVTDRWEQTPVQHGSTVAALRGTNSLPENNPEGFPTGPGQYGYSVKRWYHRYMLHEQMKHTERPLRPNVAARAAASPAMTAQESNRYTSPFAWKSFYGTRNWQNPLMRRMPADAWADQESDGTDQASDVGSDWVIG